MLFEYTVDILQFQLSLEIQIVLGALKFSETHKRCILYFTLPLTGTSSLCRCVHTGPARPQWIFVSGVNDLECETNCIPPYSSEAMSECM